MKSINDIPFPVRTDSYKAGHYMMYPNAEKMVAYGELRKAYPGIDDDRIVFFGIRYIVENVLNHKWTVEEVEEADKFFQTHNAAFTPYPFPKNLFLKFIKENNGYFPIKVEALEEGSVIYPHTPIYQITAEAPYAHLCTYLETLLTMIWYPTTVATLSRHARTLIEGFFQKTVDPESFWKLDSRLHDFGYRGCTSQEQAVIGGVAHLLNFGGSDTMSAAYYAQFHLNEGRPVATSIPATEHSVMTSYATEQEAVERMMQMFGQNELVNKLGIFATVGDSYNYTNFLDKIVPAVAQKFAGKFGLWVLRPDSGDPVECVLQGLHAAEKAFGTVLNKKGYKVINNAAVIQGDGITITEIGKILDAAEKAGFSAENIAFGMGAGLLQKLNRDTLSMATKLSHITYNTGATLDIMKRPSDDKGKYSLPGIMKVAADKDTLSLKVYPAETEVDKNMLQVVYDKGPVDIKWLTFDELKARINTLMTIVPAHGDAISTQMYHKIAGLVTKKGL
jgi:nicotinic acid phosphoribosyltransferase